MKCGRDLSADEIGLHKKLINRGSTQFMCIYCLAEFYHCEVSLLRRKIEEFREMGCMLFAPREDSLNMK